LSDEGYASAFSYISPVSGNGVSYSRYMSSFP
jgi:hypothetical protein